MTDPKTPDGLGDLPLQPTGSGVADLEIAYEQMQLAGDADTATDAEADAPAATEGGDAERESEAHPS